MREINTACDEEAESECGQDLVFGAKKWNEEWKALQQMRRRTDDASYWDKRASTFGVEDAPNSYVSRFLELACIQPGETVFDMGCGTGALSLPLGAAGHAVTAADFSSGMLSMMREAAGTSAAGSVNAVQMSWEDDWAVHGVTEESHDVCLASRSIAVPDLEQALLKLERVARRRVCITLATDCSPRVDGRVLRALGIPSVHGRDYLYAFNILASRGMQVELSYIDSERDDSFESLDHAEECFLRMVEDSAAAVSADCMRTARSRLRPWLKSQLVENEHAGLPDSLGVPGRKLRLRKPRVVTWAFLAWNKGGAGD